MKGSCQLLAKVRYVHKVLVNRLGGLSLPRKSVVRLTDRPDMTLDVYRGRKTTIQHTSKGNQKQIFNIKGNHSVITESELYFFFSAHHLMVLCICTKFQD